jgi:uncharacterized phage protein (TIGR02220 family)
MKWFKHLAEAHDDEKLSEVLCIHGPGAYGVFWLIVESIAAQMDKSDRCSAKYHVKKWASIAHVDRRTLARYLQTFNILTLIVYQECDNFVTIEIPNLLKLRDNYTKDLQVTNKKSSKQEVEVEVEEPKPEIKVDLRKEEVVRIITYLNKKTGKSYRPSTASYATMILARMGEGFEPEDFKTVIDNQCREWIGTEHEQYIRPQTLFQASKFDGYLQNTGKTSTKGYYD